MDTTTIRNVELVSVGMEWQSAGGPITFTFEHLNDAMVAANDDPHIVPPRLKIGHSDPRFADPEDPGHDPFYDGEPALGSIRNLHLINDGATLVGDYVEVPTWLAEAAPTAYPSRSIEGAWEMTQGAAGEPIGSWDVETPGGKRYSFVLTACAMLGLCRPAVQDLEDLQRFITEGDGVVIAGAAPDGGEPVAASIGAVAAPKLSADIEKVVDSFYSDFAPEAGDPRYWWWCRAVWTDPNKLIVDDDEGGLYSVPFTSDDNQNVSFGEPEEVLQTFISAPSAKAAVAASIFEGRPVASFTTRSETPAAKREKDAVHGGSRESAGLSRQMEIAADKLATRLGLEEGATEEEILTALDAEPTADVPPVDDPPKDDDDKNGEGDGDGDGDEDDEGQGEQPAAGADDSPTVSVDREVFKEMQAQLTRLSAKEEDREKVRRGSVIEAALKAGKIMPSSREAWEAKLSSAPEATEKELIDLPTGLVPTDEVGGAAPLAGAEDPEALARAYVNQHFPNTEVA